MIGLGHVQGLIGKNSKICFVSTLKKINDDIKNIARNFKKSSIKVILELKPLYVRGSNKGT